MAYSVDDIESIIAYVTANYSADDGAQDADNTSCMTNGTEAEGCDELKEGTVSLKIVFSQDESDMITPVLVRIYLNEAMTAGDNSLMPYTDSNSVSTTNEDTKAYDSPGWIDHEDDDGSFRDEMGDGDGSGRGAVRLSSNDGAKSKIGEVNADITIQTAELAAITRDNAGDVLGSVEYMIWKVVSTSPEVWQLKATGTSHASTGAISEQVGGGDYRISCVKSLAPDVADLTSDLITITP